MGIIYVCTKCDGHFSSDEELRDHVPACSPPSLTQLEAWMLAAMHSAEMCDHFCCGAQRNTEGKVTPAGERLCRTRALASFISYHREQFQELLDNLPPEEEPDGISDSHPA